MLGSKRSEIEIGDGKRKVTGFGTTADESQKNAKKKWEKAKNKQLTARTSLPARGAAQKISAGQTLRGFRLCYLSYSVRRKQLE